MAESSLSLYRRSGPRLRRPAAALVEDAADEGLEGVVAVLQPGGRWQKRQRRQRGLGGVAAGVDASAAGSVTLEVPLAPAAAASEVVDVAELPLPPPSG